MDSNQLKTIEIQLANQLRDNFAEFTKGVQVSSAHANMAGLVVAEVPTEEHGEPQSSEKHEAQDGKPKATKAEVEKDEVVLEKHQGKSYEKLLRDGTERTTPKAKEEQLFSILDEVEQPVINDDSAQATLQAMARTVPVVQAEFDADMLFEYLDEEEEAEDSESSEDSSDEDLYEDEDDVSVKETNPGYYASLVTKI